MTRNWAALGAAGAALTLALGARGAGAQTATSDRAALEERVNELEQELALVKRRLEVDAETQAGKPPAPVISAGTDGFSIRSADSRYQLKIRGYTHFDARFFEEAPASRPAGADTFYFRRIRPIFEGTLAGVVDFRIMPDFAGSQLVVQDAYANLRYLPEAQLQFGKYKEPVGLERLQSATAMWFIERALPTLLVPNRDVGAMLQGNVREGLFSYQLAWMNGVPDGGSADADTGDDKDLVARFFVHPFQEAGIESLQGLGLGFATTYGREEGAPGTYKTSGQQTFFAFRTATTAPATPGVFQTGKRVRYAPQAYWYWGPFGFLGEYVASSGDYRRAGFSDTRVDDSAWQIAGAWAITGENESYRGLIPSSSFDPWHGSWGGFELITRFSRLRVGGDAFRSNFANPVTNAQTADLWSVGVNWYLNRFIKLGLNYDHTAFDNFGSNENRTPEGVILTRVQLSY
jgi:phosphate-selective porin OprO/OprP